MDQLLGYESHRWSNRSKMIGCKQETRHGVSDQNSFNMTDFKSDGGVSFDDAISILGWGKGGVYLEKNRCIVNHQERPDFKGKFSVLPAP